jgi:hypothetical protein
MVAGRGARRGLIALALCAGCGRLGFEPLTAAGSGDGDGGIDTVTDSGTIDTPDAARTDWWDASWKRRIKLTFDNVGTGLSGFPIMVRLDAGRIDYALTQNLGHDVRFVDSDGVTVLPHEIEVWNENGASFLWVRVPLIDATSMTDFMWLYYDNASALPSGGSAQVWSGHALVWHLAEDPAGTAPQIRDSTSNGNHGTTIGGLPAGAQGVGQVAGSVGLDGSDDWIEAPASASLTIAGDVTISTWIRLSAARETWLCDYVVPSSEQEINNHLYELTIDSGNRVELQWEYNGGSDEIVDSSVPLASPINAWVMITTTRNVATNQVRFYENGVQLGSVQTFANDPTGGSASTLWVGGEDDSGSSKMPLQGRQDEFRIAGVVRSADWIAAEYRTATDAMLLYGAPEPY